MRDDRDAKVHMQTRSGLEFCPLDPTPESMRVEDIAESLAKLCRYNGHCRGFYSVAEHSVRMAWAARKCWNSNLLTRCALMHDAAEAYTGDIPRPIKRQLGGIEELEDKIFSLIAEKFGLPSVLPSEIHDLDVLIYWRERRELMVRSPIFDSREDHDLRLFDQPFMNSFGWNWQSAKFLWIEEFRVNFPEVSL